MITRVVEEAIRNLEAAGLADLRSAWRQSFGSDPPSLSRDLLARALAYRLQERAFGGLSKATLRKLEESLEGAGSDKPESDPRPAFRSGARLVREWHGRTHVVTVTDAGFDYAGSSYVSLTQIAQEITGAHWSGPRFFGLKSHKVAARVSAYE